MTKKIFAFLLSALLVGFAVGCGKEEQAKSAASTEECFTVADDTGTAVILDKRPERIAIVSMSFLEPLHAVGGEIIARPDTKANVPDYAKDVATIGPVYQINAEKLLAARPDLVILNKGMNEKLASLLKDNGISSITLATKTFPQVKHDIEVFATLTGQQQKGQEIIADMDEKISAIRAKLPAQTKRVAIIHGTMQGLSLQLPGSVAGSVAQMLGLYNVAENLPPLEKNPEAAPYSMETLAEQNPDIIFVTTMGNEDEIKDGINKMMQENPAWQSISAVKENRLIFLPQDLFLFSPGLRYPQAAEFMAKATYPEIGE